MNTITLSKVSGLSLAAFFALFAGVALAATPSSFEECVAAGNPVMESYPRQCMANGRTFTENIGGGSTSNARGGGMNSYYGSTGIAEDPYPAVWEAPYPGSPTPSVWEAPYPGSLSWFEGLSQRACTEDAMQCSDGSWVGRSGPNCQFVCPNPVTSAVSNFNQCVRAGGAVMESYPRQCQLNGHIFTENIGSGSGFNPGVIEWSNPNPNGNGDYWTPERMRDAQPIYLSPSEDWSPVMFAIENPTPPFGDMQPMSDEGWLSGFGSFFGGLFSWFGR